MCRTIPRGAMLALASILLSLPVSLWAAEPADKTVILATTTSTRDSGLLDVLLPVFEKKTGYVVKTIAVGTGQSLAMGKRGDADVVMTHAPEAEKPLVDEGWLTHRVQFMHNDYVLVGPEADPAKITRVKSTAAALRQIAEAKATFVSRGDDSGTHKQEQALWKAAGIVPKWSWYVEAGQGMGATLRIASEKQGYTLTDRSTYLSLQRTLGSKILLEGDPPLLNKYSVMLVNPAKHPKVNAKGAKAFHKWLLTDEARTLIRDYGKDRFGQPLFFLDPVKPE
ncbi:MAG: substrate-binding domain-containing protein [candidate division NC10 bacterium]|nr:substrate-binding domain-containing protein [candidate division NC10 bacterium]